MRWRTGRRSGNVEDRRGRSAPRGIKVAGGGGIGVIVLALVAMYFGVDPSVVLNTGGLSSDVGGGPSAPATQRQDDELADFVSVVLADTEDTWTVLFQQSGQAYVAPKLVLFSGAVRSACGFAQAAMGPFYCPADHKVYIDLSFYRDLKERHQAPGDFAQAYVIAHEVGHHVQNLLGISDKVQGLRKRMDQQKANRLSVRMELQADCLAGVWANHADQVRNILEQGDVEEALNAASSIGDDRLQKQARGYISPESFTHGSSAQRVRWFREGLEQGRMSACNTFEVADL